MDSATVSTKSINVTTSADESGTDSKVLVKLRRLKIEECFLTKNICKGAEDILEDIQDTFETNYCDNKRGCNKFKNSYIEIRDLFEEVKANTISQDNLHSLDIEDVKKNVLNLENKFRYFKSSLQSQLKFLKSEESDIIKEVDKNSSAVNRFNKLNKVQKKTFSEIVPSPVKNLINSPFKSLEVQEFQEFMANSKNRCGGWIPYNHEIFVKEWRKHFCTSKNIEDFNYQDVNIESSERFQMFLHDISVKLPEVRTEEFLAHNKWYTKYFYLKERQKWALEKWRLKKRLMKSSHQKTKSKDVPVQKEVLVKQRVIVDSTNYEEDLNILVSDGLPNFKKALLTEMKRKITKKEDHAEFQDVLDQTLFETSFLYEPVIISSDTEVSSFLNEASKSTQKPPFTFMNSTKQWINRCNDVGIEYKRQVNDVGTIRKR